MMGEKGSTMHANTRMLVVLVLAVLFAWQQGARGQEALYIADDHTGCIYVQDLANPGAPPVLVSGRTTFMAAHAALLSADESLLVTDRGRDFRSHLYGVDHQTGQGQHLFAFKRFDTVIAMDTDPDGNGVTVLFLRDWTLAILRLTRESAASSWVVAEPTLIGKPPSLAASAGDVLVQADGSYTVHVASYPIRPWSSWQDGSLWLVVVGDDVVTSTPLQSEPIPYGRLARSGSGEWLLYTVNRDASDPLRLLLLYDRDNDRIELPPFLPHPLLEQPLHALEWHRAPDGMLAVTRTGIWSGDGPLAENPQATELFSFLTDGRPDPAKDLTGATEILPLGESRWRVFNPHLGQFREVDGATESVQVVYTQERGTGPEPIELRDLIVGPGGTLYLLDGPLRKQRILRIDPTTGDRTVLFRFPAELPYFERFLRRPDGSFLLAARKIDTPGKGAATASVYEAIPTGDPAAPFSVTHVDSPFAMPVILSLAQHPINQHEYALLNPTDVMQVARLEGGRLVARPNMGISASAFAPPVDTSGYRVATAIYPQSLPARAPRITLRLLTSEWVRSWADLAVYSPGNTTTAVAQSNWPGLNDLVRVGGVTTYESQLWIDTSALTNLRGEWQIRLLISDQYPQPSLIVRPAPTARHMRIAPDGTIWLLQSNPPQLSIWNDETGEVADLPTIIGPELGLPEGIGHRPADFVLSGDGTKGYICFIDNSAVLGVHLADGTTWLQSPGRPAAMDEQALGIEGSAAFILAVGPTVDVSKGSRWIVQGTN
jgi:hypothetical protein